MRPELEWVRGHPVLSAIVALGSLIVGGATALLVWGPTPTAGELRAAEEQMVTHAEPAIPPELLPGIVGLALLVGLLLSVPRRWSTNGD
jgi:hypothetical protein